jgi:membrane protease YdiL (CAAX protease family)
MTSSTRVTLPTVTGPTVTGPTASGPTVATPPAGHGPRRHPLLWFFVLSCVLSWWPGLLYLFDRSPLPIAGFGPLVAALTVLGMTEGRPGIGRLFRSMVRWRVPVRSYAFALGAPVLASGAAVLATIASGGHVDAVALGLWTEIPMTIAAVLLIPGLGGAWEEPGFRGFALPRLEERFGVLAGPLLLGGFWVAWHLPLFLAGQILPTDVLTIVAASIVIAGVFRSARQSVLIVMLLHATNNAVGGSYASLLFHGSDSLRLGMFTAAAWWIAAVVVMVLRRPAGSPLPWRRAGRDDVALRR